MTELIWLIPLVPLLSAIVLMVLPQCTAKVLPQSLIALIGVGSVGVAMLLTLTLVLSGGPYPVEQTLWTWMAIGNFTPGVSFYIDGLTLVMMSIITGVGFLIHVFSSEFMLGDNSFARYFAFLNLFVAAMLILVMADNLLLLYLGWEGVGVCSYLLVGFWYQQADNGRAARKAFIVTRIGDTAMALGLLLLFSELGTLNIQGLGTAATSQWQTGDTLPLLACLLLLGGAVGKSAQLPLQTWLPDAMAGPTPVSALIHAATMVTAGVYLIARTHELFLFAPTAMMVVAIIGLATSLMAACSALVQHDIKRILAYSTISQIGYMFLALGVGAWASGIFHLMTHAFFKALLFLGSGAIIHCLHHEHNIFKMGGLRTQLPVVFWSFMFGSAALAALPLTSGFFSKDQILVQVFLHPQGGPWLWLGALVGALLTAVYSFRLVFVVFFGSANTPVNKKPGWAMAIPLSLLCVLAAVGGFFTIPVDGVFPQTDAQHPAVWVEIVSAAVPLLGLGIAYRLFLGKQWSLQPLLRKPLVQRVRYFWLNHWGLDALYDLLLVRPYYGLANALSSEPIDRLYGAIVWFNQRLHGLLSRTQGGRVRSYIASMVLGLLLLVALSLYGGGGM